MLLFHQFAKVHQVSLRNVTLCSECLALCFKCPTKWCSTKLTLLLVTHGVLPFEYKKYSTKQIDLQLTFSVFCFLFFFLFLLYVFFFVLFLLLQFLSIFLIGKWNTDVCISYSTATLPPSIASLIQWFETFSFYFFI